MDIQVALTGTKYYKVDVSSLAMALCEAGVFIRLGVPTTINPPNAQPPSEPMFSVDAIGPNAVPCITLRNIDGTQTRFTGKPEHARTAFQVMAWSAAEGKRVLQGPVVPDYIVEEYLAKFPQDAEALAARRRAQVDAAKAAQEKHDAPGKPLW
jgi:hypothetical protein